ncbi:MAG: YceI family protein, partial [Eudoraea sp.]|nr:YceI family protein [Eudoraea sp.]
MRTDHLRGPKMCLIFFVGLLFSLQLLYAQKSIRTAEITFEFVAKKVNGSIGDFSSVSMIDTGNLSASKFEGSVAVNSIKTGNFLRDWALKGKKYFDEDRHPRISFNSTA